MTHPANDSRPVSRTDSLSAPRFAPPLEAKIGYLLRW